MKTKILVAKTTGRGNGGDLLQPPIWTCFLRLLPPDEGGLSSDEPAKTTSACAIVLLLDKTWLYWVIISAGLCRFPSSVLSLPAYALCKGLRLGGGEFLCHLVYVCFM